MKGSTYIALVLFLIPPLISSGQLDHDSLLGVWNDQGIADTSRLNALYDLSWDLCEPYPDSALQYIALQQEIAEQIGSKIHLARIDRLYGQALESKGQLAEAIDHYQKAYDLFKQIDAKHEMAGTLYDMAGVHWTAGEYERAINHHRKSKALAVEIGDLDRVSSCLYGIAYCYFEMGQFSQAVEHVQQGLDIETKLGDDEGIAWGLNAIGVIYSRQGEEEKALEYMLKALEINERIGDQISIAYSIRNIASRYSDLGDHDKAMEYYVRSLEISEELNEKRSIAYSLSSIGHLLQEEGDPNKALEHFERSLQLSKEIGNRSMEAEDLQDIGDVLLELAEYGAAIRFCQQGYDIALEIGSLEIQRNSCTCLYEAHKELGNSAEALTYHELVQQLEDSIDSDITIKKLREMEFEKEMLADSLKTEEEKLQLELEHQQEVAQKERSRDLFMAGGLLLLLIAVGLFSRNQYVRKAKKRVEKEKDRSENLLLNILPAEIAEELKEKGEAKARDFDMVSILFTDFKGFTQASEQLSAADLVAEINTCFKAFDGIVGKYGIEKIKTIGDAYMCAGGLPVPDENATKNTVMAGLEMQAFMKARKIERDAHGRPAFEMRVGIHTGPVIAGIVGVKKFQYDIWGDTVNIASRMESSGEVGQVNISEASYELVKNNSEFSFTSRGKVEAKGKGEMEMYFVSGRN